MRLLPVLALSGALLVAGCQNPDGSVNMPATLALGAGVGLAALAIASADNDGPRHRHGYHRPSRRHYGHHGGHGWGHRW